MNAIRDAIDPIVGRATSKQKSDSVVLMYRMESEIPPVIRLRLKIEINTREHLNVYGMSKMHFKVQSPWFTGDAEIPTYRLDELMGTKLRALYQRRKGRDLFDLLSGIRQGNADPVKIVEAFNRYIEESGVRITQKQFHENLALKMKDSRFLGDTDGLLRPGFDYDPSIAYRFVRRFVLKLLGE
jgi:predicted nucleotidyltransferase component of viral defense system